MKELLKDLLNDINSDPYLKAIVMMVLYLLFLWLITVFFIAPFFQCWPESLFRRQEGHIFESDFTFSSLIDCYGSLQTYIMEFVNYVMDRGMGQSTLPCKQGGVPTHLL
jgi:hypothetical protein